MLCDDNKRKAPPGAFLDIVVGTEANMTKSKTEKRTLYDKIWDAHAVAEDDGETLLYIDLHLLHEVTSPQAFAGLAAAEIGKTPH